MPCAKCGAAVGIEESSGGTTEGQFSEKHKCVRGHVGYVHGDAAEPPRNWRRSGPVFGSEGSA